MKKLTLTFLITLIVHCSSFSQNGTIRGVITFSPGKLQSDKVDIGSRVFVIDSIYAGNFSVGLTDTFYHSKLGRELASRDKSANIEMTDVEKSFWNKYNGFDDKVFKDYDVRNSTQLAAVEYSGMTNSTSVDGTGNYSLTVQPGTYIIYIKSNNTKAPYTCEYQGQMYCKKLHIHSGQTSDISHKFYAYPD